MTPSDRSTDTGADDTLAREDVGYRKGLAHRQVQMIAIGGAIGSGLFLGAGGRLASAGPALVVVYAVCGLFVFLVLRALGELVLHRPTSGSFVSYAREFHGEKVAYVAGWLYVLNWAMVSIVDVTAAATYLHYWDALRSVPQWVFALAALVVVLAANLVSVRVFGELEFWAALVKVAALVIFLVVGAVYVVGRFPVQGRPTGLGMVADAGGFAPAGILPLVVVISGVVFAFAAVELVGTAAGEARDPERVMPRAINSVVVRIALFYIGSIALLALLLPSGDYDAAESPFVTFFSRIGVTGSGTIMNLVVLTAALSSLNAGLYSTGRVLRSMAVNGSAPAFTARMSAGGVPWPGIVLTSAVTLLGVGLNAVVPEQAFEIVLNLSAIGIVSSWGTIVICQLRLVAWSRRGLLERPAFRMPGAPWTGWATLVFLAGVLVLTVLDYPVGTFTVGSLVVIVPALVVGWFACRDRVRALGAEGDGV